MSTFARGYYRCRLRRVCGRLRTEHRVWLLQMFRGELGIVCWACAGGDAGDHWRGCSTFRSCGSGGRQWQRSGGGAGSARFLEMEIVVLLHVSGQDILDHIHQDSRGRLANYFSGNHTYWSLGRH